MGAIGFHDLEFETARVLRHSSLGNPFAVWVPIGMPRIPPTILDCVFYLYPDEAAANEGHNFGGTGFFVAMPSERFPDKFAHLYAVSNWHVVCRDGSSIIRRMMPDGRPEIYPFEPDQWEFNPRFDIAAVLLEEVANPSFIWTTAFVRPEMIGHRNDQLGVGDDVFMIGRFIDHDGGPINRPAARFGHISVLPAPVQQPNGIKTDSFCVDLHSRTGYSGSPVFVYRTHYSDLDPEPPKPGTLRLPVGGATLMLLGIHYAQFPELWELTDKQRISESHEPLITEGKYVKGLSGMTCVLPAWDIMNVLKRPKLQKQREAREERFAKSIQNRQEHPPEAESASARGAMQKDDNPHHKEDFTALLNAASKPKK